MFKYIITDEERAIILSEYNKLNIQDFIDDYNDFLMTLNIEKSNDFKCVDDNNEFENVVKVYFEKSLEQYKKENNAVYEILKSGFNNFYVEKKKINDQFINRYNLIKSNKIIRRLNEVHLTIDDIINYVEPIEYKKFKLRIENTMNNLEKINLNYGLSIRLLKDIFCSSKSRTSYNAFVSFVGQCNLRKRFDNKMYDSFINDFNKLDCIVMKCFCLNIPYHYYFNQYILDKSCDVLGVGFINYPIS